MKSAKELQDRMQRLSLLKPDEAEILEDLIVAAINDARGKISTGEFSH